jgi:hypothetical protein
LRAAAALKLKCGAFGSLLISILVWLNKNQCVSWIEKRSETAEEKTDAAENYFPNRRRHLDTIRHEYTFVFMEASSGPVSTVRILLLKRR